MEETYLGLLHKRDGMKRRNGQRVEKRVLRSFGFMRLLYMISQPGLPLGGISRLISTCISLC